MLLVAVAPERIPLELNLNGHALEFIEEIEENENTYCNDLLTFSDENNGAGSGNPIQSILGARNSYLYNLDVTLVRSFLGYDLLSTLKIPYYLLYCRLNLPL
ncbi:MAG: hypothetical protein JKX68_01585 [Flavobacteriales bacterium]|nr:hypothetical protein [Flavobacteriales bacterium]